MKTRYLLSLILYLFFLFQLSGQVIPDSVQLHHWNEFKQLHGEEWNIRWDEQTGIPAVIYGGKTQQYRGAPLQVAKTFLSQNWELFKLQPELTDLESVGVLEREMPGGVKMYHVRMQQYYSNKKVENAELLVHITSDGFIDMANGAYYSDIDIPPDARISNVEAYSIAAKDLGGDVVLFGELSSEIVILPKEGAYYLSWKLSIPAEKPFGEWVYFIDAVNGNILEKRDEICYVTGNGNVYPTHPGLSSVANKPLYALDGSGYLSGLYADVRNWDGTRAYSANHMFNYSPTNMRFDEVNVYYHIHRYRGEYLQPNLGFNNFQQKRAYVRVTGSPGPNNAWYSRATGYLYFGPGTGSGFNNFSHEDKIIYHEYTHAVNHSIVALVTGANESGAISEGLSDYFPASFTNRTVIGEYAAPAYQRNLANPSIVHYNQYLESSKQQHIGGEFFSAALWDLRSHPLITIQKSDALIYGAIYRLTSNPTFLSYREAVITEDQTFYGGVSVSNIKNIFAARGIGEPATPLSPFIMLDASGTNPKLNWNTVSGANSYKIYYGSIQGSPGTVSCALVSNFWYIASTTSITYTDNMVWIDPTNNILACYYVTSVNQTGESPPSNKVGVHGMAPLRRDELITAETLSLPKDFAIYDNYPNPFNPHTTIRYNIPEQSSVSLVIYDIMGREVRRLVDGIVEPGYHSVAWDSRNTSGVEVSSGMYIYHFFAQPVYNQSDYSGNHYVKKMILTK
jgi:Zn-dependent metalloprotease